MSFCTVIFRALLPVLWMTAVFVHGQEPPPKPEPAKSIDSLKLPPGTVILVSPNPRQANVAVDAVVLTPEEYRKLLEAADQNRRRGSADKPELPGSCRISLSYQPSANADVVRLTVGYRMRPDAVNSLVALGLQKCRPISAVEEGGKPVAIVPGKDDEGFFLAVDAIRDYNVVVEVEVPLVHRSTVGERGFDLGLPGAAITILEKIELPPGVRKLRINGRPASVDPSRALVLGPTKTLEAVWDSPAPPAPHAPLLNCEGRMEVRFDEKTVTTSAHLTVSVLRGRVGEFRLSAPTDARLAVSEGEKVTIDAPIANSEWIIRRPPSSEDLVVDIQLQQPAAKRPIAVGAFAIAGAGQRGTITVVSPRHFRLGVTARGELTRRDDEVKSDGDRREVYAYWSVPAQGPLLEFNPVPVRGEIEVSTSHALHLIETGWRLSSRFDISPVRIAVDRLDVEIPTNWQDVRFGPADIVESTSVIQTSSAGRTVRVRLAEPLRQPVAIQLESNDNTAISAGNCQFRMPRPIQAVDRGGSLIVSAPPTFEIRGGVRESDRPDLWERHLEPAPRPGSLTAQFDRTPIRVDLTWRSLRAVPAVFATIDVQLHERELTLRHALRFTSVPRQFTIRGPAEIAGRLRVVDGGKLTPVGPGEWTVQSNAAPGLEAAVTMTYSTNVTAGDANTLTNVPLIWCDTTAPYETEVRVWAGHGRAGAIWPRLAPGAWLSRQVRAVPENPRLPVMTLSGAGRDLPLQLYLSEFDGGYGAAFVIARGWVQGFCEPDGAIAIRSRYFVRSLRPGQLGFEVPIDPPPTHLTISLDGKRIDARLDEQRFWVPLDTPSDRAGQVLDVSYRYRNPIAAEILVTPPRPVGPAVVGPVRWQVGVMNGRLPLDFTGEIDPSVQWGFQRGFLLPSPGFRGPTIHHWLAGTSPDATIEESMAEVSLAGTRVGLAPMRLITVPRVELMFGASIAVLALSLLVMSISWTLPKLGVWLIALVIMIAAMTAWPQVAGQLFAAAQPGLVVVPFAWIAFRYWNRNSVRPVFTPLPRRSSRPSVISPSTPESSAQK